MDTIPVLPEASALAGSWIVEAQGTACPLTLSAAEVSGGHQLNGEPACLRTLGLEGAAAWRPEPDGIALTRPDRLTVAFFGREEVRRYVARQRDGRVLVLRPAG